MDSDKIDSKKYQLNWLGILILSSGGRIIFFPGLIKIKERIRGYIGGFLKWDEEFEIDHISLEKNKMRWHLTSGLSHKHIGSINTANLDNGRCLWFGLSVTDLSVFQPLFRKTSVIASIPESDVDRRVEIFKKSRKKAKFHIIELNPQSNSKYEEGFIHISFIIGPKGFKLYQGNNHGYPIDSPFIEKRLPEKLIDFPVRLHRISISKEIDIQITVSKLPGKLNVPVSFSVNQ